MCRACTDGAGSQHDISWVQPSWFLRMAHPPTLHNQPPPCRPHLEAAVQAVPEPVALDDLKDRAAGLHELRIGQVGGMHRHLEGKMEGRVDSGGCGGSC